VPELAYKQRLRLAFLKSRFYHDEVEGLCRRMADPSDPLFVPFSIGFFKPTKAEMKYIKTRKVKIP
jgi:hypothetical protein